MSDCYWAFIIWGPESIEGLTTSEEAYQRPDIRRRFETETHVRFHYLHPGEQIMGTEWRRVEVGEDEET